MAGINGLKGFSQPTSGVFELCSLTGRQNWGGVEEPGEKVKQTVDFVNMTLKLICEKATYLPGFF
jgi:hypothetical protein